MARKKQEANPYDQLTIAELSQKAKEHSDALKDILSALDKATKIAQEIKLQLGGNNQREFGFPPLLSNRSEDSFFPTQAGSPYSSNSSPISSSKPPTQLKNPLTDEEDTGGFEFIAQMIDPENPVPVTNFGTQFAPVADQAEPFGTAPKNAGITRKDAPENLEVKTEMPSIEDLQSNIGSRIEEIKKAYGLEETPSPQED